MVIYTQATLIDHVNLLTGIVSHAEANGNALPALAGVRQKIADLLGRIEEAYRESESWVRDPAMGLFQVTRVTLPLDQPIRLFGVPVPVYSIMIVRLFSARVNRDTGDIEPEDMVSEVRMPESEWASMIATPNGGHGHATLDEYFNRTPKPYDESNDPSLKAAEHFVDRMHDLYDLHDKASAENIAILRDALIEKRRIGKKQGAEIAKDCRLGITGLSKNASFYTSRVKEFAEDRTLATINQINLGGKGASS